MAKGKGKSRRIRSASPDVNRYLNDLKRNGYLIEMGGAGHWKIYLACSEPFHYGGWHCRNCRFVTGTSASPSDVHVLHRIRKQVEEETQKIMEETHEAEAGIRKGPGSQDPAGKPPGRRGPHHGASPRMHLPPVPQDQE